MTLKASEVVEYLEQEGQLGAPNGDDEWPEYEEDMGVLHCVDWRRLFSGRDGELSSGLALEDDPDLMDEIGSNIGRGAPSQKADVLDVASRRPEVCAWYQPMHYYGMAWGIFLKDDCLRQIAVDVARWVPSGYRPWVVAPQLLRVAFSSLFLHEAYHHKTEAHAVRLMVAERTPCYRSYRNRVYLPAARSKTTGSLEEALANADSLFRMTKVPYRESSPVHEAALSYLRWRFPLDPPGYRDAPRYYRAADFEAGQNILKSQVQEGVAKPFRTVSQWRVAPNMNESLFGLRSDIWTVVPHGARPTIPTFSFPLYRPASTRSVVAALMRKHGYAEVKGGKGSHIKLKSRGLPTIILPGGRKDLSPVVLKNIAVALGFRDPGGLLAHLGL